MAAGSVKRIGMELGGNAPFLVFPSADMDVVMQCLDISKFRNNGQACVAANRVLVHSSRLEEFLERSVSLLEGKKVGNGLEEGVDLGPLINQSSLDKVTYGSICLCIDGVSRCGGMCRTGRGEGERC